MTDRLLYLANKFVFTQATLTEEQHRQMMMLRADPGLCCRSVEASNFVAVFVGDTALTKKMSADEARLWLSISVGLGKLIDIRQVKDL